MRRIPLFFVFSGLELARYFTLVKITEGIVGVNAYAPQVLRLVAAPNVLFVVAFIFLGIDPVRYESYRPLLIVGKLLTLFSAAMVLPRMIGLDSAMESEILATYLVLAVAVWDVASSVFLLFYRRVPFSGLPEIAEPGPVAEPERVELQ